MSHVDEGALHAYLDGALDALPAAEAARIRQHLASCDACARRLEEERALREEAGSILAGADPVVGAMPSLEELRRQALARAHAGSGSRIRQLAWAASLVLAVGAGWMLRASRDPRISEALDPKPRVAPLEETAPVRAPERDEAPRPAAPPPAGAAAAGATAAEAEVRAVPPTAEERGGGVAAVAEPERAGRADVMQEPAPTAKAADAGLDVLRGALVAGRAQVAAPSMALTAESRADERVRVLTRAEVSVPEVAVPEAEEAPAARRARADLGALSVPGLPVLSVGEGGAELPAGTLRVLQLLDGDTLELLHLPAGADPAVVPGAGDGGRTRVAVRYGAGWLLGMAHTSTEVIEALLARVTGGG